MDQATETIEVRRADDADVVRQAPAAAAVPMKAQSRNLVYALGRVEPRFPTLGVEREWAQVVGRSAAAGLTDREAIREVLTQRANRYLVREMCWVFSVESVETYLLRPRDPADFELLVDSLRPGSQLTGADVDVVIGALGPLAPPELCNGLTLPICQFDQLYSFDIDSLIGSIPRPRNAGKKFDEVAKDLFVRVAQLADNAGATDEHRALNYLSVRSPAIYHTTAERLADNAALSRVEVSHSELSTTRRIVEVVLTYTDRATDVVDRHFVRVDVTEKYPFLASKLAPYISR